MPRRKKQDTQLDNDFEPTAERGLDDDIGGEEFSAGDIPDDIMKEIDAEFREEEE